ncbi:hypothetical protein BJY52DRAFT_1192572 [Lactarius psammicola]|nr:hypothetical protein BJY52DRAFT_1192572 [Lactarius psammicola]
MAPRTRKSKRLLGTQTLGSFNGDNASLDHSTRTDTTNEVSVISPDDVQHISDWTPPQDNLIRKGKRTLAPLDDSPGIPATVQPNPKKPRNVGPSQGRPMQLQLTGESEMARQPVSGGVAGEAARQPQSAGVNKGRGKRVVQPSPSFYPGRTYDFGPEPSFHPSPKDYDSYTSTEDDSANEEDVATLQGRPDKAHMAIALERPTWLDVVTTRHPTPVSKTASTETVSSNDDTSLGNNSPTGPMLPPAPVSNTLVVVSPSLHQDQQMTTPESSSAWPADTNLLFTPGGTRVMLTLQRPLLRAVIQDGIEHLRASLVFNNAFPDSIIAISFIRFSLNTAAENNSAASSIHTRLLEDEDYVLKIIPVLRARIPLFRSEVKERCNIIAMGDFLSMARADIVRAVEWQCSNYHYTFPRGPISVGSNTLIMHSKPYRNRRIILAIHDLYFTWRK